jgi:hypothetical protein
MEMHEECMSRATHGGNSVSQTLEYEMERGFQALRSLHGLKD